MKKILLILLITTSIFTIKAQNSSEYIEEVYSLFKIKSFNPENETKKCEILTFIRVSDKFKDATYHIKLLRNDTDRAIFVDLLDFNNLSSSMVVGKSHRQKGNVYEINFGNFYVSEYAKMQLVVIYNDGNTSSIPIDMINYKNPITIMN